MRITTHALFVAGTSTCAAISLSRIAAVSCSIVIGGGARLGSGGETNTRRIERAQSCSLG